MLQVHGLYYNPVMYDVKNLLLFLLGQLNNTIKLISVIEFLQKLFYFLKTSITNI